MDPARITKKKWEEKKGSLKKGAWKRIRKRTNGKQEKQENIFKENIIEILFFFLYVNSVILVFPLTVNFS